MEEQEKLIIDTLVNQVKDGSLKLDDIPGEWKVKVEEALAL